MKRAFDFRKLAGIYAVLALLAACSDDELAEVQLTPDLDSKRAYITAPDFASDDASRTSFVIDEGGARFQWSDKDKVGIVPDRGDQVRFEIVAEGIGGNTAAFDGGAWSLRQNHKYYAYYPFSTANFENALATDPVTAVFTGQKQKNANKTDHLGAADYMAAAVKTPEEGALQFTFDHLCALVRMDITAPTTATYSGVTLVAGKGSFVASGQFVLTDEHIAISPTETSDRMTLKLSDIEMSEGSKASFYMMAAPTDLSANEALRLELTSSGGLKYAATVPSKNFVAGKAYLLNASFSDLDLKEFCFTGSAPADIDRNTGIVTLRMPYGADLSSLVANFTVAEGAEVYVGDERQVSGETANDFSMPVQYTVKCNGIENVYTVAVAYSGIPVLYINATAPIVDKENWIEGNTLYMVNAGENNAIYKSACLRGRGNSTWTYEKKPYAIKLNKAAKVLGMPEHKRWVLLANYIDRTALRNSAAFEIAKKADGLAWTPRGYFVDVVVDGEFRGNYYLCEQIKVNKNRINITSMSAEDLDDESITGGFLCELDAYFDEVNKFRTKYGTSRDGQTGEPVTGMPVNIKDPDEEVLQPAQLAYIEGYFNRLEDLLYADNFPAGGEYREMLDVNSFIDWWLVTEIIQNEEPCWPKSSYMYKDRGGKLCAGPLWDSDLETFKAKSDGWRIKDALYYSRLFRDPYFVCTVKERWAMLKTNLADIPGIISVIAAENKASAEYNNSIWPATTTFNGDESLPYDDAVARLLQSVSDRMSWMDAAIADL